MTSANGRYCCKSLFGVKNEKLVRSVSGRLFSLSPSPLCRKVLGFELRFLGGYMQRRSFITILGGAAVALPLTARAQQLERMRRVGVLSGSAVDDPDSKVRFAA